MRLRTAVVIALVIVVAVVATTVAVVLGLRSGQQFSDTGEPAATAPADADSPSGQPTATDEPEAPAEPVGRPVARCADALRARPGAPARVRDDYWGMHVNEPIGSGYPEAPIGAVNLTTAQTYWNLVETSPGTYDFARLDAIVATAEERGSQPMVVLGFTPAWHARAAGGADPRTTMPDLGAWRRWVGAVAQRYGARLDYQIWPEPNIPSNWTGTPRQMARLTVEASDVIRDRAPRAVVVAPAVALRLESQRAWMRKFVASEVDGRPVADAVDAVALDPFPVQEGTPEDGLALVCAAHRILQAEGVDLPLWTNEINYGVPSGGTLEAVLYPEPQQVAVVARTYVLHAAAGVDRVYWLGWFSFPGLSVELARDGVTTTAGRAYAVVHDWLSGAARPDCRIVARVHRCTVERRDDVLEVVWRERGTRRLEAPDGARRLLRLDGASQRIRAGATLEVGPQPVAFVLPAG